MALNKTRLDPTGSGSKGAGCLAIYVTTDAKATVNANGYFDSVWRELSQSSAMLIKASDATYLAKVTVTTGDVALAALDAFA